MQVRRCAARSGQTLRHISGPAPRIMPPHWRNLPAPRHIFDPGRRPTIRLELPASIQDWSHIQGSELYIDSVCEQTPEMLAEKAFVPSPELLVNGWSFVPGLGIEGEVHLALIEEAGDLVIFCPASRETR